MKQNEVDTPRNGKNWCDVVNKEPMPATPTRTVMAIGKCKADGSGFEPYSKPVERKVPQLWQGDYRL